MALNIQYASDLHLEFPKNREFIKCNPLQPEGDVLVLAGDIVPFASMDKFNDFFSYVADNFEYTYWLPGNHEYYHFDIATKCGTIDEKIRSNVSLVNNTSVIHNGATILFSTLWSEISLSNQRQIERSMNDFHLIHFNGSRFTAELYNSLHADCLSFIKQSVDESKGEKLIVFSHHCPTFLNYPAQYKGDVLNEAFATELYHLIESSNIAYWGFGHHHCNVSDFQIGSTCLITNQLGYVQRHENAFFSTGRCIEILQ